MNIKAIYPGSFDPITNGHLDIINRAVNMRIFDQIIVAISANSDKTPLFKLRERVKLVEEAISHFKNVNAIGFNDLVVNFAQTQQASIIIRGLRTTADFLYEVQLMHINYHMMPKLECLFLISSKEWSFISSSIIKELARHGGNIAPFLPKTACQALLSKFQ